MLSARTVREQILPVLTGTRTRVVGGVPVAEACRMAIHDRSRETGLSYQTIVDGLRRRLGLPDIGAVHELIAAWIETGDGGLREALLRAAAARAYADIVRFFAESYPSADQEARPMTGLAEAMPGGLAQITLKGLDPALIAALQARARASGRSVEAEVEAILERVLHGGRRELATWAAGLRSRLAGRYSGDATADIRADRDR